MNDETIDYLIEAQRCINTLEEFNDAPVYAAIAQAQALTRIAECLETIVDDMAQTKRTLEEWKGEL